MYQDSYNAVKEVLAAAVPGASNFYLESVPAEPVLPSFYLKHLSSNMEPLNAGSSLFQIQWQVIYLPALPGDGSPDTVSQLAAADQALEAFNAFSSVISPGGIRYEVEEFTGGTGDEGMFLAVKLRTYCSWAATEPDYDFIQDIHLDM
ncbi:MAG: hypothetical protein K0R57_2085 [Paenibacillaceae bacterium]|jgi:hypothetical protein|nr:hypothetical protein [Paenibacillaceae bacterium]